MNPTRNTIRTAGLTTLVVILALTSAIALLSAGVIGPRAPQRGCRGLAATGDDGVPRNYAICAEAFDDSLGDGQFVAVGNVTIGDGVTLNQPSVRVGDLNTNALGTFAYADHFGRRTAILRGEIGWQRQFEETGEFLVAAGYAKDDPDFGLSPDVMEFNPVTGKIGNTIPEIYDNLDIRGESYDLFWADIAGADTNFWGHELTIRDQLSMSINLRTKQFTATIPVTFAVNNIPADDIKIGLRVVFSETGFLTGGLSDFSAKIGPAVMDLSAILFKPGEFEADEVEIMADKNPDLAMLADPAPPKPGLLVKFKGLVYKNKTFSIKGGDVAIRDLRLGDAVILSNNRIGIDYTPAPTKSVQLRLQSTLGFGEYMTTSNPLTTVISIGMVSATINNVSSLKPAWSGGVIAFNANMGPVILNLNNIKIVGDPVDNFYGLSAANVALKWNEALGSQTGAGMSGLKLGVDRNRDFKFALNGGTLGTPQLKSKAFEGSLIGTVGVISDTPTFTFTGNVSVKLPGGASNPSGGATFSPSFQMVVKTGKNVKTDCGAQIAPQCIKRVDGSLAALGVKLAGFTFTANNPKLLGDGAGFYASSVALKLPDNMGGLGATVNGLTIDGNGKASITGGNFALPPIKLGKLELKASGGFSTEPGPNNTLLNVFTGAGELKLPSVTATGSRKIAMSMTIKTFANGTLNEFDTVLSFNATAGNGIPIGTTGTELIKVSGQLNIKTGVTTITFGVGVATQARLGPIPIVKLDASTSIQVDPFKMTLDAAFKVLIFELGTAHVEIGNGAGFFPISGCPQSNDPACVRAPGFYAEITVNALFFHGNANVRVERRNGDLLFAGQASLDIGFQENQFGHNLPRKDRTFAGLHFAAGQFNVPNQSANTFGAKADFEILGWDYSIFMDWNKVGNGALSMGHNLDNFVFVPNALVLQRALDGEPGWAMLRIDGRTGAVLADTRNTSSLARADAGQWLQRDADSQVNVELSYSVPHGSDTYIGVVYTGTASPSPVVKLVTPNGITYTGAGISEFCPTLVCGVYEVDLSPYITGTNDLGFAIKRAPAGVYKVIVENAPADLALSAYSANARPELGQPAWIIIRGVGARLVWSASDADSPDATQDIGYTRVDTRTYQPMLDAAVWISRSQPLSVSQFAFDESNIATGVYRLLVKVDDRKNMPVIKAATQLFTITDTTPPQAPANLLAAARPNALHTQWSPSPERDVLGYEIGYGANSDPVSWLYKRDLGWREGTSAALLMRDGLDRAASIRKVVGTLDLYTVQTDMAGETLDGLADGEPVFWSVRAYDQNMNYSAWSTPQSAASWVLTPKAFSPGEGLTGTGRVVEIAFNQPLNAGTLADKLVVRKDDGSVVPGLVSFILEPDGITVVGLRFVPTQVMRSGSFYATLSGGANGIAAVDGTNMNNNFVWTFTMDAPAPVLRVMLPAIVR